jgi:hypothetical protein
VPAAKTAATATKTISAAAKAILIEIAAPLAA